MENNYYENNGSNENGMGGTNSAGSTDHTDSVRQENDSTYGYSYVNQEQKNPYHVWRAEENTANTQTGTYDNSAQTGTYNAQPDMGSTQSGAERTSYSSIYGNAYGQGQWTSASEAKRQKKEEKRRKREARKANGSSNFGIRLAKCASFALVFGLVAGTAFEGSGYVAKKFFGTNQIGEGTLEESVNKEKEVLKSSESTGNTSKVTELAASGGVVSIVEASMPSIVAITNMTEVRQRDWFGQVQNYEVPSAGSGIIVSEDDTYLYITTNNHVVTSATTLTVQFYDDATASAEIKGTDVSTDLAVIQVKKADVQAETLSKIKLAVLGDSDSIQVGSPAIAIGNALGYGQSVTTGVVSAVEREVTIEDDTTGESYTNNLIQTDAAINPGNSGGALLNADGEVIGINSSKYSDTKVEGMGFAIPANMAKPIIEDLITKKVVASDKAGFLGIVPETVTSSIAEVYNMPEGVFIREITKGTAADKYGLKEGDIITKIDGRSIKTREALQQRLSYYTGGTEVEVTIQRATNGIYEEKTVKVVLGTRNS